MQGTAEDIAIHMREFKRTKSRLNEILMKHCGKDMATIEKDTDRDRFMDPEEAMAYGLIDRVIESMPRPAEG
jgi:ATP-dependent Clp protease protease subunit